MALLIFPTAVISSSSASHDPNNKLAPELASLVDPSLRRDVANRVNEAILHSQGARREAKIRNLVRLRVWGERKARELRRDIPEEGTGGLDLGLVVEGERREDDGRATNRGGERDGNGNGGGAMEGVATEPGLGGGGGGGVPLPVAMET